jgi:hypothetical protein
MVPNVESSFLAIARVTDSRLVSRTELPPDRNPAAVYLASLAPGSRRTMLQSFNTVAALLTGGKANALNLDWSRVRYQHSAAIRAALGVTTDSLGSGRGEATATDLSGSDPFVAELLSLVGNFSWVQRTQFLDFGRYLARNPDRPENAPQG